MQVKNKLFVLFVGLYVGFFLLSFFGIGTDDVRDVGSGKGFGFNCQFVGEWKEETQSERIGNSSLRKDEGRIQYQL
jgi:hypothetical protein